MRAHDLQQAYRRHFGSVWVSLARLGVERADLEDAVHDVFLVAHRRRDAFSGESSVRTWLLGISRRVASDYRRRGRRHRRRVDRVRREGPRMQQPDDTLRHSEGVQLLHHFLRSLDEAKREIFVMVEFEELTVSEAARVLGINRNTAAARLRTARLAFDAYADRVGRAPPRLLAQARQSEPRPCRAARRRVMGVLLMRLSEDPAAVAPMVYASPLGVVRMKGALQAAAISAAIAGSVLGTIRVGVELWRPPAPAVSPEAMTTARRSPDAAAIEPEPRAMEESVPESPTRARHRDAPTMVAVSTSPAAVHRRVVPRSSEPPRSSPVALDPLAAQSRALERARQALRQGEFGDVLELVDAVTRQHPSGGLAPELALVRIEALCAQGRVHQARGEARILRRTHPDSLTSTRASCPRPGEG